MKLESYFAIIGSQEEQHQMDIIANNIANSNTPGYKREALSFSAVLGEVGHTDMSQGPIRPTGNKLDIALSGNGFFSVKTDQGTLYTRAGDLAVNTKNQLVTQNGWPVLDAGGSPITVSDVNGLHITRNGQIVDGDSPPKQLGLYTFAPNSLEKVGNGNFKPSNPNTTPTKAKKCIVLQGSLEGANFSMVEEMARMIQATRDFEAYQKTLKSGNNLDSELIAKTGG